MGRRSFLAATICQGKECSMIRNIRIGPQSSVHSSGTAPRASGTGDSNLRCQQVPASHSSMKGNVRLLARKSS